MPVTTAIRKRKQAYRQSVQVDVSTIRYTQTSVKDTFSNGAPLSWTVYMLKTHQILPRELPLIRIGNVKNEWRTIDNRRLYCFKTAGINRIPAIIMQDMTAEFVYKNQSYNNGININLVHDPPNNIDSNQMIMAYDPETSETKRWKISTVIQQTKDLKLISTTNTTARTTPLSSDNNTINTSNNKNNNNNNINNKILPKMPTIILTKNNKINDIHQTQPSPNPKEGQNNNNLNNDSNLNKITNDDEKFVNFANDDNNHTNLLIHNINKYHFNMINNNQNQQQQHNMQNQNSRNTGIQPVQYGLNQNNMMHMRNLNMNNINTNNMNHMININNMINAKQNQMNNNINNMNLNNNNNHPDIIQNDVFSVLNGLQHKYRYNKESFLNAIDLYLRRQRK